VPQKASISTFVQFGLNNSETLPVKDYFGLGFTGFGLVPHRADDSLGIGMAWSWLNRYPGILDGQFGAPACWRGPGVLGLP
jgi:porin